MVSPVFSGASWGAALDRAEVMELYRQARELFRQANDTSAADPQAAELLYRKALTRYEKIAWEGGIRNGKLFYNIGNTYFKLGEIGKAILNYKRAERFIPNDPNLRQNLQFAKARRIDRIEEPQERQVLKILFFWHYDFPVPVRVMLFSIFFIVFWIVATLRLFFSKSFLNWGIGITAGLAILLAGSLIVDMIQMQNRRPGVIISPEVVARKGDSETYEKSFKAPLHSGTEFILIEKRGSWYNIELPDSRRCWVPSADVELVMPDL
jgi:tetratricopeptide (TPR) repeat protein